MRIQPTAILSFKISCHTNNHIPQDELQAASWQAYLLPKSSVITFPIAYESNTDLTWSKDQLRQKFVKQRHLIIECKQITPRVGFEPTTNRLTADRSTTELPRIAFNA